MHEASIMQGVLEFACERMQEQGASRIHCLRLRVGVLSGVVPEALEFAFEAMKAETPAAEATLDLDLEPARLHCKACGHDFDTTAIAELCPQCGGWQTDVLQGQALDLVSMEVSGEE